MKGLISSPNPTSLAFVLKRMGSPSEFGKNMILTDYVQCYITELEFDHAKRFGHLTALVLHDVPCEDRPTAQKRCQTFLGI